MGDEAEVRAGGVEGTVAVVHGKIAAIPRAAEERGELAGRAAEHVEHGGELLSEQEEAPIGGWLFIAQSVEDVVGGGASGGDAARYPTRCRHPRRDWRSDASLFLCGPCSIRRPIRRRG